MRKVVIFALALACAPASVFGQALFGRDARTGEYACMWLDNTGAAAFDPQGTGRGSVAGDSVPFLFHYTATDSFHTTFVYDRTMDSWQWHMDNDRSGVRRPFARVTLTRRSASRRLPTHAR